jgi:hypothetical protein
VHFLSCFCCVVSSRRRYTLETVDLLACDFCRPAAAVSELRSAWEALSSPNDIKEEFSLSIKDISQAYATLSAAFGIPPVDGGGDLGPATKKVNQSQITTQLQLCLVIG